jgi:hypothetical protein
MKCRPLAVSLAACLATASLASLARGAEPARWSVAEEARMAAEAASWAPPDLKRQLAKHSRRLMQGVADAAAGERLAPRDPAHREAAARGARSLAAAIRRHSSFEDVAYAAGVLLHAAAMAYAPETSGTPGPSPFLGFSADPFAPPEALVAAKLPAAGAADCRAAAVTLTVRLLAWTWKTAGGDASIVTQYPESRGPYQP